ncbi:MAG TPA: peptidylprolyl isomerase [Nitrososphaeraceae archaeon]
MVNVVIYIEKKHNSLRGVILTVRIIVCKTIYSKPLCMMVLSDKIKCSHILVKKQSEALSIIERLEKGESFAELAKELSIDKGSGKKGGDLGFFRRGMMVKPFEVAAFKLEKNQISEPVKTEFGYHVIKRIS